MHHQPPNQESALNLSILTVSGPVGRLATVQEFHLSRSDTNAPVRPS
ncbi:unnamed protein product [Toxocara canis]|uniref:Uncharacterized protein n=1 Tax=Toxocara canis TaxID=6265 RepID=A0A183VFX0_TOXCA|nr:unnamed protein product [Toxocara canis]